MESVIRAQSHHAPVLGRLLHTFNVEFESPTPTAEELTARFAILLRRDDQLAFLAGDPAVGFAYLTLRMTPYYDGPVALLEELYVVPRLRDQGIGAALLTTAMAEVRRLGVAEMQINVDEVDVATRRFYERHGFVNVEPGTDYRMLFYTRSL